MRTPGLERTAEWLAQLHSASPGWGWNAQGMGEKSQLALGFSDTHGVLECQETVADPAAGGPITADVRESLVQVAVRSTKGDLFDGLVYQQVLGGAGKPGEECELSFMYSFKRLLVSALYSILTRVGTQQSLKQL